MGKPTIRQLMDAAPISKGWASAILSGEKTPSRALAVHIYRQTGWPAPVIAHLSDEQIEAVEEAETAAKALPLKAA
jgi:hypothetical protein